MTYPFAGAFHNSAAYVPGIPWLTSTSLARAGVETYTSYALAAVAASLSVRNDGPDVLRIGFTQGITGSTGQYVTVPSGGALDCPMRFSTLYLTPDVVSGSCAVQVAIGLSTVPVDQSPTYKLTWLGET